MYKNIFKPLFDKLFAIILLICSSPLTIPISIILWFSNNGKPFFLQKRPGKNEVIFKIIKFKTMNDNKDANGNLLPDANRLTWIGKFVRKSSLDEIPQMINVLKGEMSLIGPRPLLEQYLTLYNLEQKKRHLVKPGITGWAQVNGRNTISWEDKFKLDTWYVNNISFSLDLRIFIKTIFNIVSSNGISQEGEATMTEFEG